MLGFLKTLSILMCRNMSVCAIEYENHRYHVDTSFISLEISIKSCRYMHT